MKITFEPIGDKMKTREIECFISKEEIISYDTGEKSELEVCSPTRQYYAPDRFIKAKLVLPAEPEVVEFEATGSESGLLGLGTYVTLFSNKEFLHYKLDGRRWKCRFEEIVE